EGERRERLELLEAAVPPLRIAGAQRRGNDRLDERGLAVDARADRAEIARGDPVACEAHAERDDLGVGLRIPRLLGRHDAVVLELPDERRLGAGSLAELVEREQRGVE